MAMYYDVTEILQCDWLKSYLRVEASFEKSDCRFVIYGMENPHIGIQIIAVMFSMRENVDHKKGKLQLKCTIGTTGERC